MAEQIDRYNLIFSSVYQQFETETNGGGRFDGIHSYRSALPGKAAGFPCAVVRRGRFGVAERFIGNGTIDFMEVNIDIAFLPHNTAISDDALVYENEQLISKLGAEGRKFVEGLELSDIAPIDDISFIMEPRYPVDGDLMLFGLSIMITIRFEGE